MIHMYEYLQTIQRNNLTIEIKENKQNAFHLAVTRTGITLKKHVFDMHTKCIQTHLNLCNTSPVLAPAV